MRAIRGVGVGVFLAAMAMLVGWASSAPAAEIDWVVVDAHGNADHRPRGHGGVDYRFQISRFEITNAQYAEFLNAVADSDPNGLYDTSMPGFFGTLARFGSPGSYTYLTSAYGANKPVSFVSLWDAMRFANWLHNGQPVGPQGPLTTEDGAYTLTPESISAQTVRRNPGATYAVTSEDEWVKAAYYDPALDVYYEWPAGSDTPMSCVPPEEDTGNAAGCYRAVGELRDVGSYALSASPFGTYDQGGNAWEWLDSPRDCSDAVGSIRGGSFTGNPSFGYVLSTDAVDSEPANQAYNTGFRVVSIDPTELPIPDPHVLTDPSDFRRATTLVDFEQYPNGDLVPYQFSAVYDQWVGWGVLFSGHVGSGMEAYPSAGSTILPHSGTRAVAPSSYWVDPARTQFVLPGSGSPGAVSEAGLWVQSICTATVEFFDSNGDLLATVETPHLADSFVGYRRAYAIHEIKVTSDAHFTVDDVEYSAVPEPSARVSSWIAVGMLALLRGRVRRLGVGLSPPAPPSAHTPRRAPSRPPRAGRAHAPAQ